jgi:hypothetical protein
MEVGLGPNEDCSAKKEKNVLGRVNVFFSKKFRFFDYGTFYIYYITNKIERLCHNY